VENSACSPFSWSESVWLCGSVDGSIPKPQQFLPTSSSSAVAVPNPEFNLWIQQDQLVLSTIISSLSESLIAQVVGHSTSRDVWLALERLFSSHSRARIMQIHFQLATLKKSGSSIANFFQKFKNLSDNLSAAGQPLNNFEQLSFVLSGLGSEFDSLVATIQLQAKSMSIEDLYAHLLIHEQRIEHRTSNTEPLFPSTNMVSKGAP
jgi:hypothetical protein